MKGLKKEEAYTGRNEALQINLTSAQLVNIYEDVEEKTSCEWYRHGRLCKDTTAKENVF